MSTENKSVETGPPSTADPSLTFRSSGDRWCRHCSEVALVFDTETGRSRCRACGELD
jgi:hypothetical protein